LVLAARRSLTTFFFSPGPSLGSVPARLLVFLFPQPPRFFLHLETAICSLLHFLGFFLPFFRISALATSSRSAPPSRLYKKCHPLVALFVRTSVWITVCYPYPGVVFPPLFPIFPIWPRFFRLSQVTPLDLGFSPPCCGGAFLSSVFPSAQLCRSCLFRFFIFRSPQLVGPRCVSLLVFGSVPYSFCAIIHSVLCMFFGCGCEQ